MLEGVLSWEDNLSNPGGVDQERSYFQILEQHRVKMFMCFRHPPAILMIIKQTCSLWSTMTACERKCILQTDTNNDLFIMSQLYANSARSEQSYLTSSGTFIKTVFVQPEYNCIIFSCFACQTNCFCMQQVMAREMISFRLKPQLN